MNKKTIRWAFALILVVLLVLPVGGGNYVQETINWHIPETYNISGYVKSTTGSGITGVSVTNNLTDASDTTIASGYYILQDLCNRTYLITANKTGYTTNSTVATVSGANLANINITLTEIAGAPNIISWYNNYTSDNSTNFTITHKDEDNRTVFFNVTAGDSIDYWLWYVDSVLYQNSSSNNITKTWDEGGDKRVSVYGVNPNGKTQTLYWYITIEYTEYEISLLQLHTLEAQVEADEMIGQTMLFSILLIIAFVFLAAGYLSPNSQLKIFGAAFSSFLFFILAYAIIGNQFGEKLQMAWLATLLVALGIIQAIYTLLLVISLLYMMFTSRRQAGMDSIPFDPSDRNW